MNSIIVCSSYNLYGFRYNVVNFGFVNLQIHDADTSEDQSGSSNYKSLPGWKPLERCAGTQPILFFLLLLIKLGLVIFHPFCEVFLMET